MKSLQILFVFFAPFFAFSQDRELKLPLNFQDGNGPFDYLNFFVKWSDSSVAVKNTYVEIKGIPKNLRDTKRAIIWFNPQQYAYQNYIKDKINKESFQKIKDDKSSNLNEKSLTKNEIKCFVNLIIGINENNETVCIVDANNDYDFSNDSIFIPLSDTTSDQQLNRNLITVKCQRILDGKIIEDEVPILIVKSGEYIKYSVAQYATVNLIDESRNYQLAVSPLYFYARTYNQAQLVLMSDSLKSKKAAQELIVNKNDFITIGNHIYKFKDVDILRNLLILQLVSSKDKYASQVGFHAPIFESEDLLTKKNISLASFKGKYTLLDFWGTWCLPCIEQLPDLINLNNA